MQIDVTIQVDSADARELLRALNDDHGLRASLVTHLLSQTRAVEADAMTRVVAAFGRISRGFALALDRANVPPDKELSRSSAKVITRGT